MLAHAPQGMLPTFLLLVLRVKYYYPLPPGRGKDYLPPSSWQDAKSEVVMT